MASRLNSRHHPLLHTVVDAIGDPKPAGGIRSDPDRRAEVELTAARPFDPELRQVFAVFVEALNPVVVFVGDPDVAHPVDREAVGVFELAVAGAIGAELPQELAGFTEGDDAAVQPVGDPDLASGADVDAARFAELAGF